MFVIGDYCISRSFPNLVEIPHNNPSVISNLERIDKEIKKIRYHFGGNSIIITSGYRNDKLNAAVGGSPKSKHRLGCAVDFVSNMPKISIRDLYEWCAQHLDFDKLLLENNQWVHLQVAPDGENNKRFFAHTDKKGRVV